jgi:hypothetical protein
MMQRAEMTPAKKETPQFFALVDTFPNGNTLPTSHGLLGKVAATFGSRREAERAKLKGQRVYQLTGERKVGCWIGPGDCMAELCRGLPSRDGSSCPG